MQKGGNGWWQSVKIGCGPAPIELDNGWLIFYHGVTGTCNGLVYSMSAAILDKDNPAKVLYRAGSFMLTPEEWYEERGFVPNVVFPCAALCDADTGRIAIYYGAADSYVAVAYTTFEEITWYFRQRDPNHLREDFFFERLAYIDIKNRAKNVKCDVLWMTALMDNVCPPFSQMAAYNSITSNKRIVFFPEYQHEYLLYSGDIILKFFLELLEP